MGFYIPKPSYLPTPIPTLFTMFWPLPSSSPLSPFKNPPPSTSIITLTHSSLPIHKILTYIPLSSFPSLSQCSTALSHHVREYLTLYAHHNFRPYDLSVSLSDPINTFIPVHKKGSPTPTVVGENRPSSVREGPTDISLPPSLSPPRLGPVHSLLNLARSVRGVQRCIQGKVQVRPKRCGRRLWCHTSGCLSRVFE